MFVCAPCAGLVPMEDDIDRPRTHVKVQFGQSAYWVEHNPTPHPYGEVLTELLNYDVAPYEHTLCVLECSPRSSLDVLSCQKSHGAELKFLYTLAVDFMVHVLLN